MSRNIALKFENFNQQGNNEQGISKAEVRLITFVCEKVQHRHADGYPILYLLKDDGMLGVGDIAGDFNTTVDWSWVHDHDGFRE